MYTTLTTKLIIFKYSKCHWILNVSLKKGWYVSLLGIIKSCES